MPHILDPPLADHIHTRPDRQMRWAAVQAVPPRAEPLDLAEARQHLRLTTDDPTDEDDLIEAWIADARGSAEDFTGRQFVLATWELTLDRFPWRTEIWLPHPPLREVLSISYTTEDGDEHVMDLDEVIVDTSSEPGRIVLRRGKSWPSDTLQAANGVVVRYRAGHATPFTADAGTDTLAAIDHTYADGDRVRLWNSGGALPAPLETHRDYWIVNATMDALQLSETDGGSPVDITDEGTGTHFIGPIPEGVRAALKLHMAARFEHREDVIVGATATELPQASRSLLAPRRVWYPGPAGVR